MLPLVLAAALTIDFSGLGLLAPWQAPGDAPRVWAFMPDAVENGSVDHTALLTIPKRFVRQEDWNGSGVWRLKGFVVSVYREGVQEKPQELKTPRPGYQQDPWETLNWALNLDRIVPNAQIIKDPFGSKGTIAAFKLTDGTLTAVAPGRRTRGPGQSWQVTSGPGHAPLSPQATQGRAYLQPFTDTIRYVVELGQGATEIRLEPLPGKGGASKRIRLVPDASGSVTATVTHLPSTVSAHAGHSHVTALGGLIAGSDADKVSGLGFFRPEDLGGDPLCVFAIAHVLEHPCTLSAHYCPLGGDPVHPEAGAISPLVVR
jgi:hypothetical protein